MAVSLNESVDFSFSTSKGNKWKVKVIESGWGSSGYYGPEMLAEYGPQVFKKGTKVFMNHPSQAESSDRPERDVHQLAGKLVRDSYFDESTGSLISEIEFYSHYAPIIREMAEDVGLSIHALGEASVGEAEGREGPIIEALVADPLTSVDVVTVAGAGGKFLNLLESYTRKDTETEQVTESVSEGNGMSITKEEFDAAIADLKAAFVEAITPVVESVSILAEAAKPAEVVDGEEELTESIDPVEVATKFNESGLPKLALARIAESLKAEANTKSVDELIADEQAYVSAISESSATSSDAYGVVTEANTNTLVDQFEEITSRLAGARK
nr:MAG TPA: Prohead core protein protease [Caudoviricetes sp.]